MTIEMLLATAVAFLLAGTIKGIAGMGLPTTAMGLTTLFLDPRQAVAYLMLPMILANAWQVYRSGETLAAIRRYAPFSVALMVFVGVTVILFADMPDRVVTGALGVVLLLFVAVNLRDLGLRVPDHWDRRAQIIAGAIAGTSGGLTSVWAPPMALYLAARRVNKAEFVRASGLLIFLGCLPLAAGYVTLGFLDSAGVGISAVLLFPTFAGFYLGERIRHRLSETGFRKALLLLFVLMGLNLLRRAIWVL